MTKEPIAAEQDKFVLRMPDGMRDRIKRAAERNNRSMNAEIIACLEEAYPDRNSFSGWMEEWIDKLVVERDPSRIRILIEKANQAAEESGLETRVSVDYPDGDDRPQITLKPFPT